MKIRLRRSFEGPNIGSLGAATRLVVDTSPAEQAAFDGQTWDRAAALLVASVSHCPAPGVPPAQGSIFDLLAWCMVDILIAHRHPARAIGTRVLYDGQGEITLFLPRESVVDELTDCAIALAQEALGLSEPGHFSATYGRCQPGLAFSLRHLFITDRRGAGARLGLASQWESRARFVAGQGDSAEIVSPGYTAFTSHLGHEIAGDKAWTSRRLATLGLPVPRQAEANTPDAAIAAALRIGYPVVVKPRSGSKGRGVSVNLMSEAQVRAAFADAAPIDSTVVVEQHVDGDDFRLLIVGGRFAAAVRRVPAMVTADGVHTVAELIEKTNREERRDGLYLLPIQIDPESMRTLQSQHLSFDQIPPVGRAVRLRGPANVSLGGTTVDVTDQVHPDVRTAAELAARACLLDLAGVDYVTTDITASWRDTAGGIVEVNAGPGVDLHMTPTTGVPRDVSAAVFRSRLPADRAGRLPVVMVVGRYGKRAVLRWIEAGWSLLGRRVGLCLDDAGYFQGQPIIRGTLATVTQALVQHPQINAFALEGSPREIAMRGLPTDRVAVTVFSDDDIEPGLIEASGDPSIAVRVRELAVNVACGGVVIDGASAALREAVAGMPVDRVAMIWVPAAIGADATHAAIRTRHLAAGGAALSVEPDAGLTWRRATLAPQHLGPLSELFESDDLRLAGNRLKQALLAMGAMLHLGHPAAQVRDVFKLAARTQRGACSLVAQHPAGSPRLAYADPRDTQALARIALLARERPGHALSVVLEADAAALAAVAGMSEPWLNQVTEWRWAGPAARQLSAWRAGTVYPSLASAWENARNRASPDDLVVLLSADDARRIALQPTLSALSIDSAAGQQAGQQADGTVSTHLLARLFEGSWVNGPEADWTLSRLGLAGGPVPQDACVIVPGRPDDIAGRPLIQDAIIAAFAQGARAVIAPLVAPDIPRWQPVLVCDDPVLGAERLIAWLKRQEHRALKAAGELLAEQLHDQLQRSE